jgi:hypothetical protein
MGRMTRCRKCGGMIAETANVCPRCGTIIFAPRTSLVAVGLIVMLVIANLFALVHRYL